MTEVVTSLASWRERTDALRAREASIGLTMTMGALHAGHASLFARAAEERDVSLATLFVNPLQFDNPVDLERYPADLDADLAILSRAGVLAVLAPAVAEVWPDWPRRTATRVHVGAVADVLEGADRPGHFDGVATVVAKLLVASGSCAAYFGEKDFQQLCIVRQLVRDLSLPVQVVGCETVREPDGLALSSRNARLSRDGRAAAIALPRALDAGRLVIESGDSVDAAQAAMQRVVAREPRVTLAYAAVVDPATLRAPVDVAQGTPVRLLIAGVVEGVRLIDNVGAEFGASS